MKIELFYVEQEEKNKKTASAVLCIAWRQMIFHWRRRRGSNPRTLSRLLVFETSPFSLLGTSPRALAL